MMIEEGVTSTKILATMSQMGTLGLINWMDSKANRELFDGEFSMMAGAIESIQNWDFDTHDVAFNKEIERNIA
jgi:hypothetical protein